MEDRGYTPGKPRWYTPRVRGNREQAEPMRVQIKTPTAGERRKLLYLLADVGDSAGKSSGEMLRATDASHEATIRDHVLAVVGYRSRGEDVLDAEALLALGAPDVIAEVAAEIFGEGSLEEEEKKDSGARTVSSEGTIRPSTGIADDAAPQDARSFGGVEKEPLAKRPFVM